MGYGVAFAPFVKIREINVEGTAKLSPEKIIEIVSSKTRDKSILLVNSHALSQELLAAFPAIDTLQIRKTFSRDLFIRIQEREKVAVWCVDPAQHTCFAIDAKAVAFEETPIQGEFTIFSRDPLSPYWVDAIFAFIRNAGPEFLSASVVSDSQVHLKSKEGMSIFFDPREDIAWQVTKLKAVLEKKIPSQQKKNVEYLDVRFGDQAYIKYK